MVIITTENTVLNKNINIFRQGRCEVLNHNTSIENVKIFVSELNAENIITYDAVEKMLGIALASDGQTSAFSLFCVQDIAFRGLAIKEISYRQPLAGSGATSGAILITRLKSDVCISRDEVLAAYPMTKIDGAPSPGDPDPIQYFTQETGLTSLSFGFPLYGKTCLKEIIFSLKHP